MSHNRQTSQYSLTIIAAILFFLTTIIEANRSFYGEFCNKTIKCDKGAWLGCFDGLCDCVKQEEMMYDLGTMKCVSKVGERCKYALALEDTLDDDKEEKVIYEVTPCVANATCDSEGVCSCDKKFYENPNGTCTFARTHGETCDSQIKCSVYQGLQCRNETCQCDVENSTFLENSKNPEDSQCVGLSGKSCSVNGRCTSHAFCSGGVCVCDHDYYRDDGNKCHPKIGPLEKCSKHSQCQQRVGLNLTCIDGICNCDPKISQYATAQKAERYRYDPDTFKEFIGDHYTQCVGLAGSICLDRLCVPRAFCSYNFSPDFSGTCKCLPGYYQSKLGTCGHGHGESCDVADSCLPGFYCQDRVCTCQFDTQEYDPLRKICFSKVGGPCNETSPCGPNAVCENFHCSCQSGFVENYSGDCEIRFGGKCEFTSQCDSISRLKCINNNCQCGAFSEYNDDLRKCVGLVGAKCQVHEENECTDNSKCKQKHPKLMGSCTCIDGFNETIDYHCSDSFKGED